MCPHRGEIDQSNQSYPVKPLAVLLQQNRRYEECFALSVTYLSLGRSLAWDQYATGGSYFTDGPAGMDEKTEGKDGMMTWRCKIAVRSVQIRGSVEQKQSATKGEKSRAKFWV